MIKQASLLIVVAVTPILFTTAAQAAESDTNSVSSASTPKPLTGTFRAHRNRGVAFSNNSSHHVNNVSHASAEIAQLPMTSNSSQITLFGEIDGGVTITKYRGKDTNVHMSNGNWYWTSWGIKGMESLGNGNAIIFTLQQAFDITTGKAEGSGFNNQAFLGAQGAWGRLTFGHQAGLSSGDGDYSILGGSALTTAFTPIGSLAGAFILSGWQDNSIAYRTQEWNGLQLTAMYSNGTDGDDEKWSKNSHYVGVGLTYGVGNFNSNAIWEMQQHKNSGTDTTQFATFGASYDFGSFTLYGAYQYVAHSMYMPNYNKAKLTKVVNEVSGASTTTTETISEKDIKGVIQNAISLSVATPVAGGNFMLQANAAKGKIEQTGDKYQLWSVGAAYTYPLSKRTLLYGSVNYGQTGKALKRDKNSELYGLTTVFGMATSF